MEDINKRLIDALKASGLTKTEALRRSGMKTNTFHRIFNKHARPPSVDSLRRLCDVLEVSADWVIWGQVRPDTSRQDASLDRDLSWHLRVIGLHLDQMRSEIAEVGDPACMARLEDSYRSIQRIVASGIELALKRQGHL